MHLFRIKVRGLKDLQQHIINPRFHLNIYMCTSRSLLSVCTIMHEQTIFTVFVCGSMCACVFLCTCALVCVWGSHCNCRLLVSVSNCSVKLAQAVASSMKLQMKFNLLHIHCLHRDHGQDTARVAEGLNLCVCAHGKVLVWKLFYNSQQFLENVLTNALLIVSLGTVILID